MEDSFFSTGSPIRITPFHGFISLAFLILILVGGTELRIVGLCGFLLNSYNVLTRKGTVTLTPSDVRIRTQRWTKIPYSNVSQAKHYEEPSLPAWKRWLYGPGFEDVKAFMANPAVGIYLHSPRWIFHRTPFPMFLRLKVVRVYLEHDEEERFIGELTERIAVSTRAQHREERDPEDADE
jgi:hypothetical protein